MLCVFFSFAPCFCFQNFSIFSTKMPMLPIFTVDAFTDKVFAGNPAAVCPLEEALPEALCQKIAFELNLSETAFITEVKDGGNFESGDRFGLRWFTPTTEVPLCGHATLSSAHILFTVYGNKSPTITFETLSGELRCSNIGNGLIQMDFPEWKIRKLEGGEATFYGPLVKECVGALPVTALWHAYEVQKIMVVLGEKVDRYLFESLKPSADVLMQFDPAGHHVKGVMITMKGNLANGFVDDKGEAYSFVSRYFGPWVGINEDPVTGSAHCGLTPLWAKLLGQKRLYARQASPRGGELRLELKDDGRVYIQGKALTVINGKITV